MTLRPKRLSLALLPLLLGGCSIYQNITPVAALREKPICVVLNPAVFNDGFLKVYESALVRKGFEIRELPAGANVMDCPQLTTYTANWHWDMAMYMNYAEIHVYSHGRQVGDAVYDSRGGAYNMGKFIKAENKINELVGQLFPADAGAAPDALHTGPAPADAPK